MRRALQAMALALAFLCASGVGADTRELPVTGDSAIPAQLKEFPRDSLVIQRSEGRDLFQVWVATTSAQHEQGLMWVRQLAPNQGMLFLLGAPRPMTMWMKNTYLGLDMVFLDPTGRIIGIARNTVPLSTALITSPGEVAAVLEILAGESDRRGITVGDRVLFQALGSRQ
ncbi:MAG: DUF192 domain-containing protein [Pseudomonadota bacterium]